MALALLLTVAWGCETIPVARPDPAPPDPAQSPPTPDSDEEDAGSSARWSPPDFEPAAPVAAIAAGFYNTCAALEDGRVLCWGDNGFGSASGLAERDLLGAFVRVDDATRLGMGRSEACTLRGGGRVSCWGRRSWFTRSAEHGPRASNVDSVRAFAVGGAHHCAVRENGRVRCFGDNTWAQVSNGWNDDVDGVDGAVEVAAGLRHSCARTEAGGVICWGDNRAGQMGDDSDRVLARPRAVPGLDDAAEIDAHFLGLMTCARRGSGEVSCWGTHGPGTGAAQTTELADGLVNLPPLPTVREIAVGPWEVCAITDAGEAHCWSQSLESARGLADAPVFGPAEPVAGLPQIAEISLGAIHACARGVDGHVYCWGMNTYGQLGDGTTDDREAPTPARALAELPEEDADGR